jgi:type II secretory pathway predicted ATPase ExeA
MYEAYYQLREKPFALVPDPAFLYRSKRHRMALTLLEYGLRNEAVLAVISGGIGTGKTTLIHELLNRLDPAHLAVGLIHNAHEDFRELMEWILSAFGQDYRGQGKTELYRRFLDYLAAEQRSRRRTVLIVDEAQNLSAATLEELRMLLNVNVGKSTPLQLLLVGQEGLLEKLRRPELEQLAQRVAVSYRLEPLDREETGAYIRRRLEVAGSPDPELFSAAACAAVFHHSGGIPRLINLICDTALVYGFAEETPQIDATLVEDAVNDRASSGLPFVVRTG